MSGKAKDIYKRRMAFISLTQSTKDLDKSKIKQENDSNYEHFKARIIDFDATKKRQPQKVKQKRRIIRPSASNLNIDKRMHLPKTRPISPVLKSDGIVLNAFERYHLPIPGRVRPRDEMLLRKDRSQVLRPISKQNNKEFYVNPFMDTSKLVQFHLNVSEEIAHKVLGTNKTNKATPKDASRYNLFQRKLVFSYDIHFL